MSAAENMVRVSARLAAWSQAAEDAFAPLMHDPENCPLACLADDVLKRRAFLFAYDVDGAHGGWFVARVDADAFGRELVFIGASNEAGGLGMALPGLMEILDGMAQRIGARAIRTHTPRAGLVKILTERYGYHAVETVLKKQVTHGK